MEAFATHNRMMDQRAIGFRLPGIQRLFQCIQHEIGLHLLCSVPLRFPCTVVATGLVGTVVA